QTRRIHSENTVTLQRCHRNSRSHFTIPGSNSQENLQVGRQTAHCGGMNRILAVRSKIYDQFHGSKAGPEHFFKDENAEAFAAYYTSMYLIQDTGESVAAHMKRGFSSDPWSAYIEFWGVMQA